jgi:hypothetical protein
MSEYNKLASSLKNLSKAEAEKLVAKESEAAAKSESKGVLSKVGDAIGAPQRYTMNKLAEVLGVKGDKSNSEHSAQAIVQKIQDATGLPDNAAINAAKALGVAGLEVFADPTNLVPVGEIFKGAKMGVNALTKSEHAAQMFEKLSKLKQLGAGKLPPETMARIEHSLTMAAPNAKSEFGDVINVAKEPSKEIGSVMYNPDEAEKIGTVVNTAKPATQNTIIMKPGELPVRLDNTTSIGSAVPENIDYSIIDEMARRTRQGL